MGYRFAPGWDSAENNIRDFIFCEGDLTNVLMTAPVSARGDRGLLEALRSRSGQVTVTKGVHQWNNLHVTVDYLGALWHVDVADSNPYGLEVVGVSQSRR